MVGPQHRVSAIAWLWLLIVLTGSAGLQGSRSGGALLSQYPGPDDHQLRLAHMAIDQKTRRVYVAGVNVLLQLDPNLNLEHYVVTGPKNDSPLCHSTGCNNPDITLSLMDNFNKVLLLEPESRNLILCGSVYQGACSKYKVSNISAEPQFIPISVAANNPTASTVAFIGPAFYNSNWGRANIIYVGTTFTNNGEYRHDVPAIASRDLDTLDLAEYSFSKQSQLSIDVKYRDHFIVQYVYGFNASEHAYFVIIQKQSHLPGQEELGYVSRLARTCIDDANYDSYTEVTIQCVDGDTKYNLIQDAKITLAGEQLANALSIDVDSPVLVAAFRPSIGVTNKPQNHSALCLYPLRDIENKFIENIHMCFNGSVKYRNMGYISGPILDGKCPVIGSAGNIPSFCGDVGLKISGVSPISANAAVVFSNISLSAVATASTGRHNLAFLGTTDGKIKKVLLNGPKPPEYEEVIVDNGNPILPDTQLSPLSDYLYVLSSTKVSKISVEHCSTYSNCSACLDSKDPYCGWCSLEKKCTVRRACQKASHSAPRWLSSGQQCIDFEQVLPEQIPFDQMTTVRLTIRTLPELPYGAIYKCVFGQVEPIDAQVTEFGLSCATPPVSSRPKIPPKMDHILVPLSIRSSETNKDFVSKNFAYYDCGKHVTCGECVKSKWACNWCVYENKCTHNISMCQRNIISGENNPLHLSNHGFKFCPQFKRRDVIYLPNHVLKEITFEVENLPHPQAGHFGFQCIVVIEGATMLVPAKVDADKYIVCDKTTYTYEAAEGEYEATVRVVWNRNHYIDSSNIILYKCEILGSHREHADCSLCVTRNARYQCTWCGTSCQYNETCIHTPYIECPRPRIDIIKPLFGPIEGGTLVTIEGSNLGLKKSDVDGKIRIGDIPCKLVNYEVSVKIQCVSGASQKIYKAPLIVGNEAGYTQSTIEFTYQDIQLTNVYPPTGPQSGGTLLAIKGKHLNIGSQILAYLDSNICYVNLTQASNNRLTCVTSKAPRPMNIARLTLIIDNANRTLEGNPFNYTEDPTIMEIKPLSSFVSGGKMIFVHGSNLDSIQRPEMEVYPFTEPKVSINSTVCTVLSSTQMACPSPAVNKAFLSYSSVSRRSLKKSAAIKIKGPKLTLKIGFVMDDVQKMKNLDKHFPNLRSTILYMEDPRFFEFPDQIKSYKGDTLVIEGENLNAASDETDVVVTIGTKMCNVTSLAMTQLVCFPPDTQPEGTDENGIKTETMLPLVVVNVGQNLRFPIGYLKYDLSKSFNFPPEAFALIAAGITLFGFFFVAVLFLYRRKSTQAEREYKRIQIQMDTLESNVRSECKLAFAELQTDMTDLTADLENSGIPTLDHTAYVMKVFFPGVVNHPVLNTIRMQFGGPKSNYDTAVLQFEQLINNKYFLLTFINVLENQKSFSIRNKVNVASLLMVILMDKMEYATDILKCLLLALIERSVNTKHPQLMLRRTESIVEKMLTNWMALCMYRYLREYAGSSLFLLFNAIKHQIEKGLVDAVTHDARYSLSEERLLRINVEYSAVTVYIVQDDLDEKIHCKVLDCDTISQVKSKILDALFKNTPYSLRPSIYDVDLEWRHGRGGHLILQDEDLTTKTIDGWKRLNTLSHYGVKESAIMSLISRSPNDTYNNCKQPCQNCIAGIYLNDTLQSNTSKIIPNGYVEAPCNPRTYHLIRPIDDHQFHSKFLDRAHKAIPEIFLTRLLSTKGTIEKFVDDFFMAILTVNDALPPAVKWLFDLLDEAAIKYGIQDPEVVHSWKSNSLPLRFWVTFIKNPDFIFDINKTNSLDSCLSVIAQTFMDACSTSEHRLGKDSPSNKLLFAKDIPRYKEMVLKFYADVARLPTVSDQEMGSVMHQLSAQQSQEFDTISALKELYIYVENYKEPILEALSMDPHCWRQHLPQKLENLSFLLGEEKS